MSHLQHLNDPDIKTAAILGTLGTALANLNLLLTCIFLCLNIGFICWKWNQNRKRKRKDDDYGD